MDIAAVDVICVLFHFVLVIKPCSAIVVCFDYVVVMLA